MRSLAADDRARGRRTATTCQTSEEFAVGAPQREHSVSDATPTDSIPLAPFPSPPAIYPPPPPSWVWANPPPPQPVPDQRLRIDWIIASAVTAAVVLVVGGLL